MITGWLELVLEPEKPQQSNPVYTLHYNTGEVDGVHIPRIVNNQLPGNHRKDTRYRYDERGNRITTSYGNGVVQSCYQYDTQNQLIQLENFTGTHTTLKLNFTYDALGRRCAKYVTTYSHNRPVSQYRVDFLWDGNVLLAEQKVELDLTTEPEKHPKPSFNKPDAIYIHRPNSFEPLMQLRQPEPQEIPKQDYLPKPTYSVYYYLNDHLGTPQELLNKHGELVWQARTSPYGEILKLGKNKIENPIRLPGQYEDSESGLYYNRFRYYSPQDGGYINRDPIGLLGGDNLYDYPRDPVGWVDPFGLTKNPPCGFTENINPKSTKQFGHTFVGKQSHGQHISLDKLQDRARGKGHQIGQFLDNNAAAPHVFEISKRGPGVHDVPLPTGLNTRSVLPNGTVIQPDSLRVVVKPDGSIRTAYPFNSNYKN